MARARKAAAGPAANPAPTGPERPPWQDLHDAAVAARLNAHAPYSGFWVGAALRCERGLIHAGCNVENAAYPVGNCAEPSAIAALLMSGSRRIVEALVLGWPSRLDRGGAAPTDADVLVCSPCGGCRQRLREFASPGCPVHLAGPRGVLLSTTVADLLPHSFGPENL